MKYLFPLLFLASCTNPKIVSPLDKNGDPIHSVLKEPFFGTPSQPSEWSFWYLILVAIVLGYAWKEFKSIKFFKSKNDK